MTTGTSEVVLRQTLITNLRARAGLSGVQVLYAPDDFVGAQDSLEDEAIWLGETTWPEVDIPTIRAGNKRYQENYEVELFVQVLKAEGESQETADLRAKALIAEVQEELRTTPQQVAAIQWAILVLRRHAIGTLASGHGSGYEAVIAVQARLDV